MVKRWQFKMWYYTIGEAQRVAKGFLKKGKEVKITRDKNRNKPQGGKYIYLVWHK